MRKKILVALGTRPEAIKMCPVILELKKSTLFKTVVVITGQHREMLDEVLKLFQVKPDYDLDILKNSQSLIQKFSEIINGMEKVVDCEQPDLTLVHGDTLTAYATALTCYFKRKAIGHVEAGLRTYNLREPFPEEFVRQSIGIVAKYHFAPTEQAKQNLIKEGKKSNIYVTGNTAIDALRYTVQEKFFHPFLEDVKDRKIVLVTLHRRENWNGPIESVLRAIKRIANEYLDEVSILYPVHKNPYIQSVAKTILEKCENVKITEPLDVVACHNIMARSYCILTDSGGIQEEAPYFGKPVLVVRNVTERVEVVEAGTLKLIGTDENVVYENFKQILENQELYKNMSKSINPYGNGQSGKQIVDILEKEIEKEEEKEI